MSARPDSSETLSSLQRCLEAYQRLLDLAEEQERILAEGRIADLPPLLLRKAELVERAGAHLARVRDAPSRARAQPAFRSGVETLRGLMARLVEVEERCARAAPPTGSGKPRAQAAAAYRARSPGGAAAPLPPHKAPR